MDNKVVIKAKGYFVIWNFIIYIFLLLFIDSCFIFGFSNLSVNEMLKFIFLSIVLIAFNIYVFVGIKWLYSCRIIFTNDRLILNTLQPKTKNKNDLVIFLLSLRTSKYKIILAPKKNEIFYKDIIDYGYVKDLKIKKPFIYGDSIAIVTDKKKYFILKEQFSKKQIIEILKILDDKIK